MARVRVHTAQDRGDMRRLLTCMVVLGAAATALGGPTVDEMAPTVTLPYGSVHGRRIDEVDAFLNIPFALPPTGSRRFRPPVDWDIQYPGGAIDAGQYGNTCPGGRDQKPEPMAEDCLTVNVYVPRAAKARTEGPLPVLVWIYGGSFIHGSNADPRYHAQNLASRSGVVVVSVNYRLEALGWLAADALRRTQPQGLTGNNGLMDQLSGLRWVQKNIAAFGGDASRVTVFGESAGAISISDLLVIPSAEGLFHRAIVESGNISMMRAANTTSPGNAAARHFGCTGSDESVVECLQKIPVESLLEYTNHATPDNQFGGLWQPIVDGVLVPAHPYESFQKGAFSRVPVIVGSNSKEGAYFVDLPQYAGKPVPREDFVNLVNKSPWMRGESALINQAMEMYPPSSTGDYFDAASYFFGEGGFSCEARRLARLLGASGVDVWLYHFAYVPRCPGYFTPRMGSTHMAELPFLFRTLGPEAFNCEFGDVEDRLADDITGFWANFATSGDPNGPGAKALRGAVRWPRYVPLGHGQGREEDINILFGEDGGLSNEDGYLKDTCEYWDNTYLVSGWDHRPGPFPGSAAPLVV